MSVQLFYLPIILNIMILFIDMLCIIAVMTELLYRAALKRKANPLLETYLDKKRTQKWNWFRTGAIVVACIILNVIVFKLI